MEQTEQDYELFAEDLYESAKAFMSANCSPQDIFSDDDLSVWAHSKGYLDPSNADDIAELEQWAINNGFLKFDSKTGKVSEVDFEDVLSYEEVAENE